MTSRAIVSLRSNTDWIICRSSCSTTPRSSAMSTSSRSSTSDANGPSRSPRPGVIALPISTSRAASGLNSRPEDAHRGGAGQRDPVRVLAAERARPDADQHVTDDDHDGDGQQRHRPARAELRARHDRDQHGGGQLARHPQQQQQVRVARAVVHDRPQRLGARALLAQELLGPGLRHATQRGVDAGDQTADRDQAEGDDERDDVGDGHRDRLPLSRCSPPVPGSGARIAGRLVVRVHSPSSRACSSNIVFSSSASPWS